MSSIEETVTRALRERGLEGYIEQVKPIVATLNEREYDIADNLVSYAASHGLPAGEAKVALEARGMMFRPPVVAAVPNSPVEDRGTELAEIRHALVGLLERVDRYQPPTT